MTRRRHLTVAVAGDDVDARRRRAVHLMFTYLGDELVAWYGPAGPARGRVSVRWREPYAGRPYLRRGVDDDLGRVVEARAGRFLVCVARRSSRNGAA